MLKIRGYLFLVFLLACTHSHAQMSYGAYDTIVHEAIVYNGDTLEMKTLDNVYFYSRMTGAQRAAMAKYNRLRNAVYVTYPYARKAGIVMNEMNTKLQTIKQKDDRKSCAISGQKNPF